MTTARIDIALCIDAGMLMPATVALSSIAQHVDPRRSVRVFVVTSADEDALAPIRAASRPTFEIIVKQVDNPYGLMPGNFYITPATYLRFLLPDILDVDKVLYLDADIVVSRDIATLFDVELGECAVAAVPDVAMSIGSLYRDDFSLYHDDKTYTFATYVDRVLGRRDLRGDGYFNAGVMLIGLDRWRRSDFVAQAVDFLTSHPDLSFMDQDGLNVACAGRYVRLDPRWNSVVGATVARAGWWRRHVDPRARRWEEICGMWRDDAWITHYAGPRKPWKPVDAATLPAAGRWWSYAMRSPARSELAAIAPGEAQTP